MPQRKSQGNPSALAQIASLKPVALLNVWQCDGQQPKCSRCDSRDLNCIYPITYSSRLSKAEDQLKEAHNEVKRLSSYITSLTGQTPDDIPDLRPQLSKASGIPEANWRQNLEMDVSEDEMSDLIHAHPQSPAQVTM